MGFRKPITCIMAIVLALGLTPAAAFAEEGNSADVAGGVASVRDGNDSKDAATSISVGQTVNESLEDAFDSDFFKFTTDGAGPVSITFGADFVDTTDGWSISLRDGTGIEIETWRHRADTRGDVTYEMIGLPAGSYFVHVYRNGGYVDAPYRLRVNHEVRSDWETEDNDSMSDADRVEPNSLYYGSLMTLQDNDYFKFTTPGAGPVSITFGSEFVDTTDGWSISLRREAGSVFDSWSYRADAGSDQTFELIGLPAGTYFVEINRDGGHVEAPYHFKVNYQQRSDWESESNDSTSEADRISPGSTYYGSIMKTVEYDYFKFTLDVAGPVSITFGSEFADTEYGWAVSLLNANGNRIDSWTYRADAAGDATFDAVDLSAGTYYLRIAKSNGHVDDPYHFCVNAPGNTPPVYGFTDVADGDWFATDDVLGYATSHGLLKGYDGTTLFGPYDPVTRGQVATILWRVAGEPSVSAQDFSDVDYGEYYGAAIKWARSTGVVSGYGDTNTFGPENSVTRQELCVMLANYAKKVAHASTFSTCAALDRIAGSNQVASWAREAMGWAVDEGIISGEVSGGTAWVNPEGPAQRCAVAKMVAVFHRDVLNLG